MLPKKSIKWITLMLVLLMLGSLAVIAGCDEESEPAPVPEEENDDEGETETQQPAEPEQEENGDDSNGYQEVVLYFSDDQAMYLVPEVRNIIPGDSVPLAEAIIIELIAGPVEEGNLATLPENLEPLSLEIKNGTARVDFNHALRSVQGSTGEIMAIYSITNSLAELEEINNVEFLIDGSSVEALSHIELSGPVEPDWDLVN